jgi:tricorn protease
MRMSRLRSASATLGATLSFLCPLESGAQQPALQGALPAVRRDPSSAPQLLQHPAISATSVAFVYAGDLWTVPRQGGEAKRLTAGGGTVSDVAFSPDGSQIAYTGDYDGNVDVYVMPAAGGQPRRLTYHPDRDEVVGWTPNGDGVVFRSRRKGVTRVARLFSVGLKGGLPTEIPLPTAYEGSYAPGGERMAYMPLAPVFRAWKRYRGGTTSPIWLVTVASGQVEKVPRTNSNDFDPMWVAEKLYFLSDRNGPVTLFAYDTKTRTVAQALPNEGVDMKSASAGPGAIVYEQFGKLHVFDIPSASERTLNVRINADIPAIRPRYVNVARNIINATISPTGARAAFEARNEIFTVPAEKGDARDLTNTPGVAERDPSWSPDGKWVAYFSDESGEYALHLRDQSGLGAVRKIDLGTPGSFYYSPVWSPDSKKIAYSDKRLTLWIVDIATQKRTKVDTHTHDVNGGGFDESWSPDGRWLAYTRELPNYLSALYVFDLSTGETHRVSDGLSDVRFPVFDRSGKYLFFTESTDLGMQIGGSMASFDHPATRSVYVTVLRNDLPSPAAPESDEEKADSAAADSAKSAGARANAKVPVKSDSAKSTAVRIDFEGIDQRILALPIPARNYVQLSGGKAGVLFLLEGLGLPTSVDPNGNAPPAATAYRFNLATRKLEKMLDSVSSLAIARSGEKALVRMSGEEPQWLIVPAMEQAKPGSGTLNVGQLQAYIDPREEWRQMYHDAWRIERDFFYDANFHGLDWAATGRHFEQYLDGLASRDDFVHLLEEMYGDITVGHLYIYGGGDTPPSAVRGGLLGADYSVEQGRYRVARVYRGENWNPQLRAPLTEPGVNVKTGDYLLAVNGRDLHGTDDVDRFLNGTAGKQVVIRVGPSPDGAGARDVTVVPIGSEQELRKLAWIDDNRRKVEQMTNGRVAYVYLPNTAGAGYTSFNRYYFAQTDKDGAVIDERMNGGGAIADYMIQAMQQQPMFYGLTRDGSLDVIPRSIYGPKAMIVNESAGSGGDALPWMFHHFKLGTLVGTRTWGGLVGIGGYPQLADGMTVTAPRWALFTPNGDWEIENHGVAPDIEVEVDPASWRAGHDPQLERAVQVVLDDLQKNPPKKTQQPKPPVYQRRAPTPVP